MQPRQPVYVPSKGRHQENRALTIKALLRDDVPFHVVVEPQEADAYRAVAGEDRVLVLPFRDLGLGSIPARNWIREHAEGEGHSHHWQIDDNVAGFYRLWNGRRVPAHGGTALRVLEDFAARFRNVGVAGLNYDMFVPADTRAPYYRNVHVYSCTLVDHRMPYWWRGRFNEDTDLCLQALSNGWCTLLLNSFSAKKVTTMTMGGGNTELLYRDEEDGGDARDTLGRYEMARSLEVAWPGLVKVIRNFGRYQHSVNWGAFDGLQLELRDDLDLDALPEADEYGLTLRAVREIRSERIRQLQAGYPRLLADAIAPDPLWRGLPAFVRRTAPPKLSVSFQTEKDRDRLVAELGVTVDKKFRDKGWSAWYPPRGRDDPASLRFEPEVAA